MNLTFIKKIILSVLLVFVCQISWGQTLSQLIEKERLNVSGNKDDTSTIMALNDLGRAQLTLYTQFKRRPNRDSIFLAYNLAMNLANQLKIRSKYYWQMRILSALGETECYIGDTVDGKKKILTAINFFRRNRNIVDEFNCWGMLNESSQYRGKYNDQLAYLRIKEQLALKYFGVDMVVTIKEQIINALVNSGYPDTGKTLYVKLINEYKHTHALTLDYAYGELAYYYRFRGDLSKGLYYALAGENWMPLPSDTLNGRKSFFYGELAEIYQLLGQSEKSIQWYKKTIDMRRKIHTQQVFIYRTAGFLVKEYIKLKKVHEALAYINNLSKEYPPTSLDNEANLWQIRGYCYEALGKFDLAEQAYLKMIKDYNAVKEDGEIMDLAIYDIGKFYINRKQYKKASAYINTKNLSLWTPVEVRDYQFLLFKMDSANRNYLSAIKHLNIYKSIGDSIFNATKSQQIAVLEVTYATHQKEEAIKSLKKESLLQDANIKQANTARNWTLAGSALLLIVTGLLFNSYQSNKRKTKEINLKNASLNNLVIEKDALLQEKEWLMKEIHHRVKNNLQIVMGLLQRQSSFIDNEIASNAIQDSEHRMHSIALIHQKLYQSDNYTMVNMADYIAEMIGYLQDSFGLGTNITFEKKISSIDLDIASAVPLGLIINEAITNAIKYAFPAGEKGSIQISLEQTDDDMYALLIADNGRGLPAGFDIQKTNTMGFNLMRGLSKQLSGTFNIDDANGVEIRINFRTDRNLE